MRYIYNILGVLFVVFLASCSSTRKMSRHRESVWLPNECVTARANMAVSLADAGNINLSGTLKMKRDDVIQINATYILGIPVGNVEFTRDSVLVVSRTTRQYIVLGYQELSLLMGCDITFQDFQNIFWGEIETLNVKGGDWKCKTFTQLADGRHLPEEFAVSLSRGQTSVKTALKLSNYRLEKGWGTRIAVNTSRYTQLSVDQLVKLISILLGK